MPTATLDAPNSQGFLGHAPIDCDIHPAVPDTKALLPYFDDYWRETILQRGIDRLSLNLTSYPPNAPLSGSVGEQLSFPQPKPKLVTPDYPVLSKALPDLNDWWLKNIQHA